MPEHAKVNSSQPDPPSRRRRKSLFTGKRLLGCGVGCVVLVITAAVLATVGYQALRRKQCPIPEARDWVFYYELSRSRTGTGASELKAFRAFRPWGKTKRTVLRKIVAPTGLPGYTSAFDVSPDGTTFAATVGIHLWLVDLRTGRRLWHFRTGEYPSGRPVFSHDGRKIGLFCKTTEPPGQDPDPWKDYELTLYLLDVKGASRTKLASGFLVTGASPVWSGDDSFVYGVNGQRRVMRVDVRTGETEVLEETEDAVAVLAVSGSSIVYYGCEGRSGPPLHVWKCRLDGTEVKLLRSFEGALTGIPSADGRYVFVDEHIAYGAGYTGFLDIENEQWHSTYDMGWPWIDLEVLPYGPPNAWVPAGPVSWPA